MSQSFSTAELAQLRQETPGLQHTISFNAAGSSLPPASVLLACTQGLEEEAMAGGYAWMEARHQDLEQVYGYIAGMLGARPADIACCESATDAWYRALHSIDWKQGDEILISRAEYGANLLAYLDLERKFGVRSVLVEDNEHGEIDLGELRKAISPNSRLICLSHMPTNGGLVNPAEEVGAIAREHGLLYLLDACQTVGQKPLDVAALQCDFLTATGRKYLRGPRGTGFLYVNPAVLDQLHPDRPDLWSAQWSGERSYAWVAGARRFENFEFSRALRLGLGESVRLYQQTGPERIWERIQALAARLRAGLSALPGVEVRDQGRELGGIVTFTVEGKDPDTLHRWLAAKGFQLSVNRQGTAWLDMPHRGIGVMLRASVHYFLLEEEIDRLVGFVGEAAEA